MVSDLNGKSVERATERAWKEHGKSELASALMGQLLSWNKGSLPVYDVTDQAHVGRGMRTFCAYFFYCIIKLF